nr:hypothetical protein GCM10020092_086040 [Actinoplanes digitatis]
MATPAMTAAASAVTAPVAGPSRAPQARVIAVRGTSTESRRPPTTAIATAAAGPMATTESAMACRGRTAAATPRDATAVPRMPKRTSRRRQPMGVSWCCALA